MLRDTLQIFGYKCLGEGDEQTGGFFGGNVGNVEVHQARISDGVLNFPLLDWIKLWTGDINSFTLANCRYSYYIDTILLSWHVRRLHIALKHHHAGNGCERHKLFIFMAVQCRHQRHVEHTDISQSSIYNTLSANAIYLPDNWKQGTEGTTVNFK